MNQAKAQLRFYRQSPKKVRQVVDVIRGLDVLSARAQLAVLPKSAAKAIDKLLDSAIANAENREEGKLAKENLFIKEIKVDQGPTYKRYRPRAHGRAMMIRKKTSHISLVLAERDTKEKNEDKQDTSKKESGKTKKAKAKLKYKKLIKNS